MTVKRTNFTLNLMLIAMGVFLMVILFAFFLAGLKMLSDIKNNIEARDLLREKIINSDIDLCDKYYLLSMTTSNIHEKNYFLSMNIRCIITKRMIQEEIST